MAATSNVCTGNFQEYIDDDYFRVCTCENKDGTKTVAYTRSYIASKHYKKLGLTRYQVDSKIISAVLEVVRSLGYESPRNQRSSAKIRAQYKKYCRINGLVFYG
jgi:hypothetical protein